MGFFSHRKSDSFPFGAYDCLLIKIYNASEMVFCFYNNLQFANNYHSNAALQIATNMNTQYTFAYKMFYHLFVQFDIEHIGGRVIPKQIGYRMNNEQQHLNNK